MGTRSIGIEQIGIKRAKAKVGPLSDWTSYWTTTYIVGLTAYASSDSQINLSWTDAFEGKAKMGIYRSTDNITFTKVGTSTTGATTYSDTGLTASTLYYYKVRAESGSNYSYWSNTAVGGTASSYSSAFITLVGETDPTKIGGLHTFVAELIAINSVQAGFVDFATPANGVLRAAYPFMGLTATTQKWNLIDPRDADDAFRITWDNDAAGCHTANGYVADGINQKANTKFSPAAQLVANYGHLGIYCLTAGTQYNGSYDNTSEFFYLYPNLARGCMYVQSGGSLLTDTTANTAVGFTAISKVNNNYLALFKNGKKLLDTTTVTGSGALPATTVTWGAINHPATPVYSAGTFGFCSVGSGITDAANQLFGQAVLRLMVSFGRRTADIAKRRAGVCFTVDDKVPIKDNIEIPWLSAMWGFRYTHAIDGWIPGTHGGVDEWDVEQQRIIKANLLNGNSLAAYTRDRNDAYAWVHTLGKTPQQYYDDNVAPNNADLLTYFGGVSTTFLFPRNTWETTVAAKILEEGLIAVASPKYLPGDPDYSIYDGSSQILFSAFIDDHTIEELEALVDLAYTADEIIKISIHTIDATAFAKLELLCAYINSKGMTYYNLEELVPALFE